MGGGSYVSYSRSRYTVWTEGTRDSAHFTSDTGRHYVLICTLRHSTVVRCSNAKRSGRRSVHSTGCRGFTKKTRSIAYAVLQLSFSQSATCARECRCRGHYAPALQLRVSTEALALGHGIRDWVRLVFETQVRRCLAKEAYRFDDGWLRVYEHSGATEQMHIQEGLTIRRSLGRCNFKEAWVWYYRVKSWG